MKGWLTGKLVQSAGQGVVELALVLPLLVLLALGGYDLSRAIQANNIIINLSREGANLALRTSRATIPAEDIMDSLSATAQPLIMANDGTMCVTQVQRDLAGTVTVQPTAWSHNSGNASCPMNPDRIAQYQQDIQITRGQTIYVFEIGYNYHSLFLPSFSPQLYSATVF